MKYNSYTQKKIEAIFEELGYVIRYEKGSFQSGYCIVENRNIVIINRFYDTEAKINCLIDILSKIEVKDVILQKKTADLYTKLMKERTKE